MGLTDLSEFNENSYLFKKYLVFMSFTKNNSGLTKNINNIRQADF